MSRDCFHVGLVTVLEASAYAYPQIRIKFTVVEAAFEAVEKQRTWRGREPVPTVHFLGGTWQECNISQPVFLSWSELFLSCQLTELLGGSHEMGHSFTSTPLGLPQVQVKPQQARQTIAAPSNFTAPSGQQK